eukprot:1155327-Pelagomonas_calceolata.AAC.2
MHQIKCNNIVVLQSKPLAAHADVMAETPSCSLVSASNHLLGDVLWKAAAGRVGFVTLLDQAQLVEGGVNKLKAIKDSDYLAAFLPFVNIFTLKNKIWGMDPEWAYTTLTAL